MKNKLIRLLAAALVLTLSSCAPPVIRAGTFGPCNPYRSLGGVTVATGFVGGFCQPGGIRTGFVTRPIPRGYGNVPLLPYGPCISPGMSPGYPGNYPNSFNQPFGNCGGNPNLAGIGQAPWRPSPRLVQPNQCGRVTVSPRVYNPQTRLWLDRRTGRWYPAPH